MKNLKTILHSTTGRYMLDICKNYNNIIFSSCHCEFGWDLFRFCGYIRKYKLDNPNKNVKIHVHESRKDLYTGVFKKDDIITYQIDENENDYSNCYSFTNDKKIEYIINLLQQNYPEYYISSTRDYKCNRNIFIKYKYNYNFKPNIENKKVISKLLLNNKLPVISVFSRYRIVNNKSIGSRNWDNWEELYNKFSKKYLLLICGSSPGIYKSKNNINNVIYVENYNNNKTTTIGLTIEAIKASNISIGSQTSLIVLSNLLQKPTIFWGHDINRLCIDENPFNNKCIGLLDKKYNIDIETIEKELAFLES